MRQGGQLRLLGIPGAKQEWGRIAAPRAALVGDTRRRGACQKGLEAEIAGNSDGSKKKPPPLFFVKKAIIGYKYFGGYCPSPFYSLLEATLL